MEKKKCTNELQRMSVSPLPLFNAPTHQQQVERGICCLSTHGHFEQCARYATGILFHIRHVADERERRDRIATDQCLYSVHERAYQCMHASAPATAHCTCRALQPVRPSPLAYMPNTSDCPAPPFHLRGSTHPHAHNVTKASNYAPLIH
jgi:hypothetical protein